jgi:hypothetical protein
MIAVTVVITVVAAASAMFPAIVSAAMVVVAIVVIGAGGRSEGQTPDGGENGQSGGFESRHVRSLPNTPVSGRLMHEAGYPPSLSAHGRVLLS